MNADILLKHFDRISEAPDAIPRLRKFILDLAVRGKLIEQDQNDEPASDLLKQIQMEKVRLVKAGAIRKQLVLEPVRADEEPFEICKAWCWVRFGEIADFSAGRTPSRHDTTFWNTGDYPWISIADMTTGETVYATKETVSEKAKKQVFSSEPSPVGTMIMSFKLSIGKIARLGVPAFHNEAIISIRPHIAQLENYLFMLLPQFSRMGDTKDAIKGATLNRDSLSNMMLPLPPIAEQHRIVAKVDELMALCDQLETARNEREARRDRLVASSFNRISTAAAKEAKDATRFHLDQLPRLTTRIEHIKQLRQAILNLAVRGRLVPQDPNDEPASALLKRIQIGIKSYGTQNRVQPATVEAVNDETLPFTQPAGWTWTRLASLCRVITDGDHLPPPKSEAGVAFLTIGNISSGALDFTNCRYVSQDYFNKIAVYRRPEIGDLLYTVVGATYGRPALIETDRPFCVQRHIAILKPAGEMLLKYLYVLLGSPFVYEQATRSLTGAAQPTVPLRPLRNFLVPLPPLAEQHRIVAKDDELMALCDQLEAQLTSTENDSRRLLEAVLRDALNPVMKEAA